MKLHRNKGAGSDIISNLKSKISEAGLFLKNLFLAFFRFDNKERILFFALILVLLVLLVLESMKLYRENTKLTATSGGEYVEVMRGEAKYFTPVLAKSDAEKTISHLVYSALIKIDESGQPIPDLASSWEVSTDGLSYTFHLRQGVVFQKGQTFDSSDVAATVASIQDEANKSPLRDTWSNVTVETPDPLTAIFKLPKSYGPFIYSCIFEIVDSEDAVSGSLSSSYNGTGPYSFVQALPDGNSDIVLSLKANSGYYNGVPMISSLKFLVAKDQSSADKLAKDQTLSASAGFDKPDDFIDKSFKTGRNLIMFFNLRKDALKDAVTRKKIVAKEKFDTPITLTLLALNADPQKSRAEEFAAAWKDQGLNVNLKLANAADYADAVKKRDYDLLLYGYDWAYDRDPYAFWHTSQIDKNNFSGYSDKNADIALEDARLILDPVERNKRYEAVYQKIKDEALAVYYDQETYPFYMSGSVKNTDVKSYGRPEDRFNNIGNWYIKEKRVRK